MQRKHLKPPTDSNNFCPTGRKDNKSTYYYNQKRNTISKCSGCQTSIGNQRALCCSSCEKLYDLQCANVSLRQFFDKIINQRQDWICEKCKSNGVRNPETEWPNDDDRQGAPSSMSEPEISMGLLMKELLSEVRLMRLDMRILSQEMVRLNQSVATIDKKVGDCQQSVQTIMYLTRSRNRDRAARRTHQQQEDVSHMWGDYDD